MVISKRWQYGGPYTLYPYRPCTWYELSNDSISPCGRSSLLSCRFFLGTWNMKGFLNEERPVQTLRHVLTKLQDAYCSTIGYEVRPFPASLCSVNLRIYRAFR